jgi:hypothetical protein
MDVGVRRHRVDFSDKIYQRRAMRRLKTGRMSILIAGIGGALIVAMASGFIAGQSGSDILAKSGSTRPPPERTFSRP